MNLSRSYVSKFLRDGRVYNDHSVDFYSPKAIQLCDEMNAARQAMQTASLNVEHAAEIVRDGDYQSSDGALGLHQAAARYRVSVEQYREAMTAWA
jgi:hypothetical protein